MTILTVLNAQPSPSLAEAWPFMAPLAVILVVAGLGFMAVAAVGFVRLPDVFCRLHVTGILDTLGAPLVLLGMAVWVGPELTAAKLVLGLVFLFVTSPLVGHLLSQAAAEQCRREGVLDDSDAEDGSDCRGLGGKGPIGDGKGRQPSHGRPRQAQDVNKVVA